MYLPTVQPTCPKCDSHQFHLRDYDPPDFLYKIMLLCCSKCGAVVGTTGFKQDSTNIDKLISMLDLLAKKLGVSS